MKMMDRGQGLPVWIGSLFFALSLAGASMAAEPERISRSLELAVESEVFLRRGDGAVTQLDLDARIAEIPERMRAEFLASPDRLTDMVNALVTARQMFQAALADQPDLIEDPVNQARIMQQVEQSVSRRWLEQRWQRERLEDYTGRARELYLGNPSLFRQPSRYDITVAWIQPGAGQSELEAMRRIIEIHDAAQAEDLADVSRRLSDRAGDGQAQVNFERVLIDDLDDTVGRMVRTLSAGEISDPFRAASGWYIVRLDAVHRGEIPEFEQIVDRARQVAEKRHREAFEERLLRAINAEPVTVAEVAVDSLLSRYPYKEEDRLQLLRDIQRGFEVD